MLTSLVESFAADFTALAETYAWRLLAARIDLMRGGFRSAWPFTAISDPLGPRLFDRAIPAATWLHESYRHPDARQRAKA